MPDQPGPFTPEFPSPSTMLSRSSRLTTVVLVTSMMTLPSDAHAQRSTSGERGVDFISFASGNAGTEGFSTATASIQYRFAYCNGMGFAVSFQVVPGSGKGLYHYWMDGQKHEVDGGAVNIDRPGVTKLPINIAWRGGPIKSWVSSMPSVDDSDLGCGDASFDAVAPLRQFFPNADKERPTPEQIRSVIDGFSFQTAPTQAPLRHFATREAIAARLRVARQDSVRAAREKETAARDEARRRDSLARVASARQDSVAKARATNGNGGNGGAATPASGATTGTVAGQGRVRPGTSTSLDRNGTRTSNGAGQQPAATQRQETYDERMARQAEARRQAQRDSAVAAEQRRREALANLERQRQETAERNARIEENTEKLAQATVGLIGSIGDIRRANAEERERKERMRQERIEQHYRDARMAYLSRPPRPRCTPDMPTQTLELTKAAHGTITGNECELADSTSAVRYTFTVAKPGEFSASASGPNDFTGRVRIAQLVDGVERAPANATYLVPGTYALYVSGLVPGETGAFTVYTTYLPLYNNAGWGLGGAPFLGSYTIGDVSKSGWGIIGRISYGFTEHVSAVAAIEGGQAGDDFPAGWQVGGRGHLPLGSRRRVAYVQATTGKMYLSDVVGGSGSSIGAGVELFSDRSMAFEIGLTKSFGSLKDADFPAGGSIDYGATMLSIGMTTR